MVSEGLRPRRPALLAVQRQRLRQYRLRPCRAVGGLMLARVDCKRDPHWLATCRQAVREQGCCIVERALARDDLGKVREAMYRAQERIVAEVGKARLERAGERGEIGRAHV